MLFAALVQLVLLVVLAFCWRYQILIPVSLLVSGFAGVAATELVSVALPFS
jgi:hypothetical protein